MNDVAFAGTNGGVFTSTGVAQTIQLPFGVDWFWCYNETIQYATGAGTGAEFYWRNGMPQGQGTIYTKTASTQALAVAQLTAGTGFYLVNNTINIPGAVQTITGISNATPPVVSASTTTGLINGSIVRIYNTTGALQLGGLDFTVSSVVASTSFDLAYMAPIATATGGTYSMIPYDPYYYPTRRYITAIDVATAGTAATGNPAVTAAQSIVTLSVTHGYQVGQKIRFVIPMVDATHYGMTQLNNVEATIVAIGDADALGYTNTIRTDANVSSFPAFAFPLTTTPGFTPAQVIPVGENTAYALNSGQNNILSDATVNTGYFGLTLQAGASSPAGVSGNVISWIAGKNWNQ